MLMPEIIGLYSPLPRSGKGTAASVLVRDYGYFELRFSDPIRRMWAAFNGVRYDNQEFGGFLHRTLEGDFKEQPVGPCNVSYRDFAVSVGNSLRSDLGWDIWIKHLADQYERLEVYSQTHVVISDVRYPNEYEWIRDQGGQVWRLERSDGGGGPASVCEGLLEKYLFDVTISAPDTESVARAVHTAVSR